MTKQKTHEKGIVIIEFRHEVQVTLPEGVEFIDADGTISEACKERAIAAAVEAFPQKLDLYIDGIDEKPISVYFEVSDSDAEEVRGESDD